MPRPPQDGRTRAGRIVRVLRYLSDCGGSADSTEIRDRMPAYQDDPEHRKWRRDMAVLRSRGLVAVNEPGQGMSARVEMVTLKKPERLFLTFAERDVLAEVEDQFRHGRPAPSPLPEGAAREVDEFARLTRYLEERPGRELTYTQVEQALGLRRRRLTELLEQITVQSENDEYVGSAELPALAWIEYWSPEVHPPDGYICNEDIAAMLGAEAAKTFDPRKHTGQLGFWAYSAAETDDRIDLIDRALAELDLSAEDRDCLYSAQRKLREWKMMLPPG